MRLQFQMSEDDAVSTHSRSSVDGRCVIFFGIMNVEYI